MLARRAVKPREERYSLNETFEKLRRRKNHLGVEGSQRGGNSQHCQFKTCEDEKSHYLLKIVMSSRVAKERKNPAKRVARRPQTSISTITVSRRRHEAGFKYCLDFYAHMQSSTK